jgi:hypothetical protein
MSLGYPLVMDEDSEQGLACLCKQRIDHWKAKYTDLLGHSLREALKHSQTVEMLVEIIERLKNGQPT